MEFNDNNHELFLGKYSSESFDEFYEEYEELMNFVNSLPAEIRAKKGFNKKNLNYNELSRLLINKRNTISSNALFRKNNRAKDSIIDFWLYGVNAKANIMENLPSLKTYTGITTSCVKEILSISNNPEGHLEIPLILMDKGIILIYEKSLDGLNVDGIVYKNKNGNPIVSLSIRHNRVDNFWFTLAHELSHIVLHYDLLDNVIIDDLDKNSDSEIELHANKLAADFLIPKNIWRSCPVKYAFESNDIKEFAKQHNLNPAIVAGRIRKERNNYSLFNDIIYEKDIRGDLFNG